MPVIALGASDCEALHPGWLGQPVNAVSSLAYVAAGAYALRRGGPLLPAVALGVAGVGSLLYHGPMPPGARLVHDGSLAALAASILALAWWRRSLPRPPVAALAAFGAAVAIDLLTRTGAPLCRPHSVLQGHAAWHLLTALALALWLARWRRPVRPSAPSGRGPRDRLAPDRCQPPSRASGRSGWPPDPDRTHLTRARR